MPHLAARIVLAAATAIVAIHLNMAAQGAVPQASTHVKPSARTDTPSGLPVPRFVSLKAEKTFCRAGPTFAHPVRITFMRRGLPVMIVAETRDHWRKIRDADGDECWIHRTKLSGAKTAIVLTDGLALRASPNDDAPQKAQLGRGLIARIESTREGWLKVSANGARGWARETGFWGAANPSPPTNQSLPAAIDRARAPRYQAPSYKQGEDARKKERLRPRRAA